MWNLFVCLVLLNFLLSFVDVVRWYLVVVVSRKAVTRIFLGCRVGAKINLAEGVGFGEGVSPSPENFCIFISKW